MTNIVPISPFPSQEHYQKIRRQYRQDGYSAFTNDDLWYYHAYDYGWRRAYLKRREEFSPVDSDSRWFNSLMADRAERFFEDQRSAGARARRAAQDALMIREGRGIINEWAQSKGASDIDAYALMNHLTWSEAYRDGITAIIGEAVARKRAAFAGPVDDPNAPTPSLDDVKSALGLKVAKPEFSPTPEEMAAGRRQLGIERPEEMAEARRQLGIERPEEMAEARRQIPGMGE